MGASDRNKKKSRTKVFFPLDSFFPSTMNSSPSTHFSPLHNELLSLVHHEAPSQRRKRK